MANVVLCKKCYGGLFLYILKSPWHKSYNSFKKKRRQKYKVMIHCNSAQPKKKYEVMGNLCNLMLDMLLIIHA